VIEKLLTHLEAKDTEPKAARLPPGPRRPRHGCSAEPDHPTMPQGCDASGAATVAAGLVAGATGRRVSAEPWLGGRPRNVVPGQTGPLLTPDRPTTDDADGGEEGLTPDKKAAYPA
jgi:hypothetical protein